MKKETPTKITPIKDGLSLEQRLIKPKEVVRVIAFQSISGDNLEGTQDLQNISFTRSVWVKKSEISNNPNQIMPIGGNVDKGENLETASQRELREETHLVPRFGKVAPLKSEQKYTFFNKGKAVSRISKFTEAYLLPNRYDKPYSLHNKEDKIGAFEFLTTEELKKLFTLGKITTKNGGASLLDSLLDSEEDRLKVETVADTKEIQTVKSEILERAKLFEAKKKLEVLRNLILHKNNLNEKKKVDLKEIQALSENPNSEIVQAFWSEIITKYGFNLYDIRYALRASNYEEYIQDLNGKFQEDKQVLVPTINLIFPLLFGANFDIKYLPLLKQNPQMAKLYKMSRVLYLFNLANSGDARATNILSNRVFGKDNVPVNRKTLLEFFQKSNLLSKDFQFEFEDLAENIDQWFRQMQEEAGIPFDKFQLDQKNEVQSRNLNELLELAFGNGDKQIVFEAQRKLILIYMLHEVKTFGLQVSQRGIGNLDKLESNLETPNVISGNTSIRKILLQNKVYDVVIERRKKTDLSLLRKVIVRDSFDLTDTAPYRDIFAESIIFKKADVFLNEEGRFELEMITDRLPSEKISDAKGKQIKSLSKFSMPKCVFDYIQTLSNKATQNGEQVEISEWKGLPDEDKGFRSNSAGGGGKLRLCKFYINHISKDGVKSTREVQIFLPREITKENGSKEIVSGEYDYDFKKTDDDRYSHARLLSSGIHRSVVELLFPVSVYGEGVKSMFD